MATPRRPLTSCARSPAGHRSTLSRRAPSMSRTSVSSRTREGMLLTAPGNTSHTPTVPRCRSPRWIWPLLQARESTPPPPPAHLCGPASAFRRRGRLRLQSGYACWPEPQCASPDRCRFLPASSSRPLLDMQLDELMKAPSAPGQPIRAIPLNPACVRNSSRPATLFVAQGSACCGRQHSPAIMRLPRQPMPKRVGSSAVKITSSIDRRGLKPSCLQHANRLKAAEHAHASVIQPRVGNGVDMRAGTNRRKLGVASLPARKGVADCVFAAPRVPPPRTAPSRKHARAGPLR